MNDHRSAHETTAFVDWFRRAAPYINAHRGRTFVIEIDGESADDPQLHGIVHDLALLRSLGVELVVVHGARPWIERRIEALGLEPRYAGGVRITDRRHPERGQGGGRHGPRPARGAALDGHRKLADGGRQGAGRFRELHHRAANRHS